MSSSSSYSLKTPTRCLVSHAADEEHHGFLVGTANLQGPNELRLLRYFEDDEAIECAATFSHDHEVVDIAACPFDPALAVTVQNTATGLRSTLWRMPGLGLNEAQDAPSEDVAAAASPKELLRVADLRSEPAAQSRGARLQHVQWCPGKASDTARLVSVDESMVRLWDVSGLSPGSGGGAAVIAGVAFGAGDASFVGGVAWDPHHVNEISVAVDNTIQCWDVRTGDALRCIASAAPLGACIRSLSYNPNKPWHLSSASDDFRVKIWDLRKVTKPLRILDGHTHWATAVAYNPFHDQLLISGGADGRVNLWRVSSVSSAPLLELGDEEIDPDTQRRAEPKLAPDSAIRSYDDHDDTVASVAWSSHSAWVFASLSYPGKVVVCQVPSAEKYRVLL